MTKSQMPTQGQDPHLTNRYRKFRRRLTRDVQRLRVTSERGRIPRKRKKYVHKVNNYAELLLAVMHELAKRNGSR
jgi:hypothetical protein